MEPTEPENRKAQEQDSPPQTQEIEVSRGWDEHLRMYTMYWLMDKSDLSFFPCFFAGLLLLPSSLHNRHLPDRDPAFPLTCSNPCEGPEFGSPKKTSKYN